MEKMKSPIPLMKHTEPQTEITLMPPVLSEEDAAASSTLDQSVAILVEKYGGDAVLRAVRLRVGGYKLGGFTGQNCSPSLFSHGAMYKSGLDAIGLAESSKLRRSSELYNRRDAEKAQTEQLLRKYKSDLANVHEITMGILEHAINPMFTLNERGMILMTNKAAMKQFGFKEEELVGQCISIIVGNECTDKYDSYSEVFQDAAEERVRGKKTELTAKRKDGSEFPVELAISEMQVASQKGRIFCAFIRDLSSQKKFEQDLKHRNAVAVGIIEASSSAMFAFDKCCNILMVNEASCKKFGYKKEEFLGKNMMSILDCDFDSCGAFLVCESGVKKVTRKQREMKGRKKDGTVIPLMVSVKKVHCEGSATMYVAYMRDVTDEKRMMKFQIEKAQADALLTNMLPKKIALRLKDDPSHIADHYTNTTILFADIVGFTRLSGSITAVELVEMLNDLFSRFDFLVDRYKLNKVKTIGDCYMVTSIPDAADQKKEASQMCHFSLDMLKAIEAFNTENAGHHNLSLRIGINTGPVVAGVVGTKRFMYDLWGDAVNVASRMESTGEPGRVQVTDNVVSLVPQDEFLFEHRGKISVKGKGEMDAFFLTERMREPEFAAATPSLRVTFMLLDILKKFRARREARRLAEQETDGSTSEDSEEDVMKSIHIGEDAYLGTIDENIHEESWMAMSQTITS